MVERVYLKRENPTDIGQTVTCISVSYTHLDVYKRQGLTDLPSDIVAAPDKFRAAYRRERAVELMFENHRWWDIRRWMILEETFKDTYPIKGSLFTPRESNHGSITDKSTLTYDYEQIDITPEVRSFTKKNYW